MCMNKIYFVFLCFIVSFFQGYSQSPDSLTTKHITLWHYQEYMQSKQQVAIDTTHAEFFEFQPNAHISKYELDLGSFASPAFSLEYSPLSLNPWFIHPFLHSQRASQSLLFYNAPRPYTELYYSGSQFQQQQVNVLHTQNYSRYLNAGVRLHYYKSIGEYAPQTFAGKQVAPWIMYNGSRISAYSKYAMYSYDFDVNGGILDDSLLRKPHFIMSLQNAHSKVIHHTASNLIKWNVLQKPVSIDTTNCNLIQYPLALGYTIHYDSYSHMYSHSNLPKNWYAKTLWDTLNTKDTTLVSEIKNAVFIELNGNKTFANYNAIVSFGHQYNHTNMRMYDASYPNEFANSLFVNTNLTGDFNPIALQVRGNYLHYMWGEYKGNNTLDIFISKDFEIAPNNPLQVTFGFTNSNLKPQGIFNRYISNHYVWNNSFNQQHIQNLTFQTIFIKYKLQLDISKYYLQNYLYFNTKGMLLQSSESAQAFFAKVNKVSQIWKLTCSNGILLQTNSASGIDYPQWATYNSIAFRNIVYKKLIDTYIGIEGLLYPKYFVPQYNTSLNVFTQQFDKEIGGYPHVNAFFTIKYKPVRFMVTYNGLYTALYGKNFIALHYPQQSGYVTFAVSWLFYN